MKHQRFFGTRLTVLLGALAFWPAFHPPCPAATTGETNQVLTLRQALALALERSPELAVFPHELRAIEARELQAGLRPNPELGVTVENVLGTGTVRAFHVAETTLQLGQLIELGGKRLARIEAVAGERQVVAAEYEVKRAGLLADTAGAFIRVLAAQEAARLARERVELAQKIAATTGELVAAGKISPVEETRARAQVAAARIDAERAGHTFNGEKARLVAHWGDREARFVSVWGALDEKVMIPEFAAMAARLEQNPAQRRWLAELARRQAEVSLADARRTPDVTVSGGVRELSGPDDRAFVLGLSVPLPFNNRNQGAREEARQRVKVTEAERASAEVKLYADLRAAHESLLAASSEAAALAKEILPASEQALAAITEGYTSGKFGYLDVLEAQRALFAAREQRLRALAAIHLLVAELERLLGAPLNPPPAQ
jgi:outer membrane protein, heavy metal efflux system